MNRSPAVFLLGALAALLAGCSSPQYSRIDQNRAAYESWPLDIQQAVLDGKVEPGMTPEMVRVAWGAPTKIETPPSGEEIWIYEKGGDNGMMMDPGMMGSTVPGTGLVLNRSSSGMGGVYPYPNPGMGGVGAGGPMGGAPIYTAPTPPEVREVIFRDGVVHKADKP